MIRLVNRLLLITVLGAACRQPGSAPAVPAPLESYREQTVDILLADLQDQFDNLKHDAALESLRRLRNIARHRSDMELETIAGMQIALIASARGDSASAIEYYRQVLPVTLHQRNPRAFVNVLNGIALEADLLGRYGESVEAYRRGLAVARQISDTVAEATALNGLMLSAQTQKERDVADMYARDLLGLAEAENNEELRLVALEQLGRSRAFGESGNEALGRFLKFLRAARREGDLEGEVAALEWLGNDDLKKGANANALERFRELTVLYWELGDRQGEARTLLKLGLARERAGEPAWAVKRYEQSLAKARELGDPVILEAAHRRLGMASLRTFEWTVAEHHLAASRHQLDQLTDGTPPGLHRVRALWRSQVDEGLSVTRQELARLRLALAKAEELLADVRRRDDLSTEGSLLFQMAYLHQKVGEWDEAARLYEKAQGLEQRLGDTAGERMVLSGWIQALDALEEKAALTRILGRFLELTDGVEDPRIVAMGWDQLAAAHLALGEVDAAVRAGKRALFLARKAERSVEPSALETLAEASSQLGDGPATRYFAEQLATIALDQGDFHTEGRMLRLLATDRRRQGDLVRGLELCGQSRDLARRTADLEGIEDSEHCLGLTYLELGDHERTVAHARSYREAARRNDDGRAAAEGIHLEAIGHLSAGRIAEAKSLFAASVAGYRTMGRTGEALTAEVNLAIAALALGQEEEALGQLQEAGESLSGAGSVPAWEDHDRHQLAMRVDRLLSRLLVEVHRPQEGIALARRALRRAGKAGDEASRAAALENLGFLLIKAGQPNLAEQRLEEAAAVWADLRRPPGVADLARVAPPQRLPATTYELLQLSRVRQGEPFAALIAAEQRHGFDLVRTVATRPAGKHPPEVLVGAAVRKRLKERNLTLVVYSVVHDFEALLIPGMNKGSERTLEQELLIWVVTPDGHVVTRQVNLEKRRHEGEPSLAELVETTLGTLRGTAPPPGELLAGCGSEMSIYRNPAGPGGVTGNAEELLARLYEVLIRPIADSLPENPEDPVAIVPHGATGRVPFVALLAENGYLIEHHTLWTAPSVGTLLRGRRPSKRPSSEAQILVIGDPVLALEEQCRGFQIHPGARREAETIARQLGARPLVGSAATRREVLRRLQQAKWVHFAAPADLIGGDREYPGALLLAGSRLTARDIAGLELAAEIVVLSAWDTGRGPILSDGAAGLVRAFSEAGASSLVATLWPIPNSGAEHLMADFYRLLQRDRIHGAYALRMAMLEAIRAERPLGEWAGFAHVELERSLKAIASRRRHTASSFRQDSIETR